MQAYTPSREDELSGLCRNIRRTGEEKGLDPETEALLKMLEKPPFEDEADRIIRELNEAPSGDSPPPPPPAENSAREKGRLPDGMMKAEARPPERKKPAGARKAKPARDTAAEEGRKRHPAAAVMLVTFSALLVAGAAFIVSSYRDGGSAEEIPATPASLCEAGTGAEGYILGIEGESLAVYYNGALQQSIDFPAAQLTDYDRELLQKGIQLEDEAAVKRAIEDYTS